MEQVPIVCRILSKLLPVVFTLSLLHHSSERNAVLLLFCQYTLYSRQEYSVQARLSALTDLRSSRTQLQGGGVAWASLNIHFLL